VAGRSDIVELWPFAQSEFTNTSATFVDRVLAEGFDDVLSNDEEAMTRQDYLESI
jgi:predicted AAA+ superfamily ATPase